jgi:hypothetical protein
MSTLPHTIGAQTTLQVGSHTMPVFSITLAQVRAVMDSASRYTKYKIPFEHAPRFVHAVLARFHALDLYLHADASQFLTALLEWYEVPTQILHLPDTLDDAESFYVSGLPLCVQRLYVTAGFSDAVLRETACLAVNEDCMVQCKGCLKIWDGNVQCSCEKPGCGDVVDTNIV